MNHFKIFSSIIFPLYLLFGVHCQNLDAGECQNNCSEKKNPSSDTLCKFNHKPAKIYEQPDSDSAENKTEYCQYNKKSHIRSLHFSPPFKKQPYKYNIYKERHRDPQYNASGHIPEHRRKY